MARNSSPDVFIPASAEADLERDLIRRCMGGDQEAFSVLIAQNQARLFHVVFRLLRDSEEARDILQETFLNAYLNLEKFQGHSRFSTWLYRIAVNAAISHRRKRRPLGTGHEEQGGGALQEAIASTQSPAEGPHARLDNEERQALLMETLNQLSLEHRSVLILKDIDDLKYETIAEILSVPIGTVRSRLNRARAELRQKYLEAEGRGRGVESKT